MSAILLNAFGFLTIILVGYCLKRLGLVKKTDGKVISTIVVTITLPATVIVGLNTLTITSEFVLLAAVAIITNLSLVLLAKYLWREKEYLDQGFLMFSISGYNVGNFAVPFIQSFFPVALPYLFMFDVGNCIMIAGGSKMIVESSHPDFDRKEAFRLLVRTLLNSIPFLTYLLMVVLRAFTITLPSSSITIFSLFASANGFLSLLMIGIYLELVLPQQALIKVAKILSWRYLFSAILAGLFYFVIPFTNPMIKIVLTVLAFAPIPTFAVINSVAMGVEEAETGFIFSVSILLSLALMTLVMFLITFF